jgi:flagellum-specific ATP synthase
LRNKPPPPHSRQRMGAQLDLGVRAVNTFLATCRGQRMGIFSGSGVGKSILLSMMARYTAADVSVIGLVGERGREVQEFLEDDLGPEGLARSVVVVATGDEPALMRRQAAYTTLAVAEYFRDRGRAVLCLMDSVTRFAMAQREIGLSAGEPPTTKGYPPTTFSELARLLERAGPGAPGQGSITGLFSVLVEGDDANEPISDAARGILDGHIVMERAIADRGRYPAVNVLKSVSRSMPKALSDERNALLRRARQVISAYEDMAELIKLGAYRKGSDAGVDEAISLYPKIEAFLAQNKDERTDIDESFRRLAAILGPARA